MGAYLSQPKTDKISTDERNKFLAVGASSMQGWRNNQEDAHNAILVYDENTSFFAVYDGHGGPEVAAYCADKLPDFLKNLQEYKNADFEKALKAAFLGFDKTLLETDVVNILKVLADENQEAEAVESEDDAAEDLAELHEESSLSLKEVLKRYGNKLDQQFNVLVKKYNEGEENDNDDDDDDDDEGDDAAAVADGEKASMPNKKIQLPYLRGRRAAAVIAESVNKKVLDPESQPAGSSTSAAAAAAADGVDGPSSSKTFAKIENDDDAVVSSTNNLQKNVLNNHVEEVAGKVEAEAEPKSAKKTNGEEVVPDSSRIVKENEQNGSVTSSESTAAGVGAEVTSKAEVSTTVAKKKEQQNGASQRISASSSSSAASSSKSAKAKATENSILMDDYSTDDDADYDETTNSEDDDEDDEDADGDGDDEADDDDDDDDDELEDDDEGMRVDDAETIEANEKFCANMIEEPGQDSGCTAVVALLHGRDLYVANAGDSRCVVSRNGKAIEMSFDHKPEDPEENSRILKAGGRVSVDGRVNGGLNLSRAIGDHAYKLNASLPAEEQMISALPDVRKLIISPEDEFMVLACDGIWNFMSSSDVVDFVRKRLDPNDPEQPMSKICEELFDNCLAPNTMGDGTGCDNMTAVIVRFQPSIQELNTKLNADEVEPEPKVQEKVDSAESSEVNTMKRSASSSLDDQKQQNKRLKTDKEEENTSSATSSQITSSTNTSKQAEKSSDLASSSSSASSTISTSEVCTSVDNQPAVSATECDSGLPDSSEVSAGPS